MLGDFVAPISTVTARQIIRPLLAEVVHDLGLEEPNLMLAIQASKEIESRHGWRARPEWLLDVWTEMKKNGGSEHEQGENSTDA